MEGVREKCEWCVGACWRGAVYEFLAVLVSSSKTRGARTEVRSSFNVESANNNVGAVAVLFVQCECPELTREKAQN